MARQNEVIEPRKNESETLYQSWTRKIGNHSYRFKVKTTHTGESLIQVDMSLGFKKGWKTVHLWHNHPKD